MPEQINRTEAVIRRNSVVELSLVVTILGGVIGGTVWATKISVGQETLKDAIHQIRDEQLPSVRDLIQERTTDRWTLQDMRRWVNRANREAEIYAHHLEQLEEGEPPPTYLFPDPSEVGAH